MYLAMSSISASYFCGPLGTTGAKELSGLMVANVLCPLAVRDLGAVSLCLDPNANARFVVDKDGVKYVRRKVFTAEEPRNARTCIVTALSFSLNCIDSLLNRLYLSDSEGMWWLI
jgi:hypothetical protein